ncbi:ATP-binding protein [Streptomyces thermodiastaticus]
MAEPVRAGSARAMRALERILSARGIHLAPEDRQSETTGPGHPEWHRRARAEYALSRWRTATPPRFRNADATLPEVVAWADRALADPSSAGALLLPGLTGTGKTYEAYGALRRIAAGGPERFELIAVNSADMYGSLRPSPVLGASERELRRLSQVQFLLLDDFGTAKASEWTEEITYRLINHRYNHCLPTIITSNLPARDENGPDLTDFVGDRGHHLGQPAGHRPGREGRARVTGTERVRVRAAPADVHGRGSRCGGRTGGAEEPDRHHAASRLRRRRSAPITGASEAVSGSRIHSPQLQFAGKEGGRGSGTPRQVGHRYHAIVRVTHFT